MAGIIEIGVDLVSVADLKSPTAAIEALQATGADVGTIFADTYQNLPSGGGGGGGSGNVTANSIIAALGYTPVAPGDTIELANNALFANVATTALVANNATYLNGQPDTYYIGLATSAYGNAQAYADTKAAQAYTNAIATSGNAAQAYSNAIAWSGNAAAAYVNAVAYSNLTFLPLAGGTVTGNVAFGANISLAGDCNGNFRIRDGTLTINNPGYGINFPSGTFLTDDAFSALALRAGTNPQTLRIYNTHTDSSNYERLKIAWESNTAIISPENAGTGVNTRSVTIRGGSGGELNFGIGTIDMWRVTSASGHFHPIANLTYDVGAATRYVRTVYANNLVGTANNATNLGGQPNTYYTNATNITTGTLPFAQLPSNNSVTNTSIAHVSTANNVKTAYDAAIAANTLANTASTKADAAYTNAVSFATTIAGTAYTNATSFATTIAGTSYANAIAFAANASTINSGTIGAAYLPASGVTAATYGNSTYYPIITVDVAGRVTVVTTSVGGGGGGGLSAGNGLTSNATHYAVLANTGIIANATGTYVNWPVPGQIGSTTANSGAFTTLTATANTDLGNNSVTGARMKAYKEFNSSLGTISTNNVTLDLSTSNFFDMTLANNAINVSISNPPATGNVFTFTVIARQDATGSRVLTWPASVKWPNASTPALTTTANKIDILQLMTVDGGTSYYGGFSLGNL